MHRSERPLIRRPRGAARHGTFGLSENSIISGRRQQQQSQVAKGIFAFRLGRTTPRHASAPRAVAARRRRPPGLAAAGPSPGGGVVPLCLGRSPSTGPGTPPRPRSPRSTGQLRWRVAAPEILSRGRRSSVALAFPDWVSASQLLYGLRSGLIDRSVAGCPIRCGKHTSRGPGGGTLVAPVV